MATIPIRGERPTVEEFAVVCREQGKPQEVLGDVSARDVIRAARSRGVPVKDGRVVLYDPYERTSDGHGTRVALIYFALAEAKGVDTTGAGS